MPAIEPVWKRIGGNCRTQGRIDSPRQAKDNTRESVGIHIVAQANHHRVIGVGREGLERRNHAGLAHPAGRRTVPAGQANLFLPICHLVGYRSIGIQHEGGAVKNQLILTADTVEVGHWQAGLANARGRDDGRTQIILVDFIRAAVRSQQKFRTLTFQMRTNVRPPDVFADGNANADAAERDGVGQGAACEQALFVKSPIVGKLPLQAFGNDRSALKQQPRNCLSVL